MFKCSPITPNTLLFNGDLNITFLQMRGDLLLSKLNFFNQIGYLVESSVKNQVTILFKLRVHSLIY